MPIALEPVKSYQVSPDIPRPSFCMVNVVPFERKASPEVLGATKLTGDVPFPSMTLFAVNALCPVPPSATAKSVIPVIEPPVIATLLAFCVDIVPKVPKPLVTAVAT